MNANIAIQTESASSVVNYVASVIDDKQTMTSLQIAEITGKRHADVMRDVRNLLEQGVQERNFALSYIVRELPNGGSKQDPIYILSKKGCLILASGYNALLREKIIDRWTELETAVALNVPKTYSQALMLAAKQAEQIEEQQRLLLAQGEQIKVKDETIEEMLPKVSYYEQILNSKAVVAVTQIAKDYGMSGRAFNKLLSELHIQYKVNDQWVLYSEISGKGYAHSETFIPQNSTKARMYTKWTQRGRLSLYDKLKQRGVLPLIEQN